MSKNENGVMLAGMRKICLELPQVEEFKDQGTPAFKAGDEAFARIGHGGQPVGPTVSLKLAEKLAEDARFSPAEQKGWLTLALHDTSWEGLNELAKESYQSVATQAMLEELEAQNPVPADII